MYNLYKLKNPREADDESNRLYVVHGKDICEVYKKLQKIMQDPQIMSTLNECKKAPCPWWSWVPQLIVSTSAMIISLYTLKSIRR